MPNQIICNKLAILRPYALGTIGLFHTYKGSKQHAKYSLIVGMTGGKHPKFRVYLPSTDRVIMRSKPKNVIADFETIKALTKGWGFPMRNESLI
jgi:hypothetical protein